MVAFGSAHVALHGPMSNGAPPAAIVSDAAVSCRPSWRRGSPCGDRHMASRADDASPTPVSAIECPHTTIGPCASRIDCVIAGCVL